MYTALYLQKKGICFLAKPFYGETKRAEMSSLCSGIKLYIEIRIRIIIKITNYQFTISNNIIIIIVVVDR